ncbi:MAG: DegT/DnrJ/EryC1/StrS family aminotransferase [Cytophagales bacterium]|nr:MAG: DegT/DnrJ/EryC1/StrS family aminotransferase [Cytophagales bacterium]
MTEPLFVTKSYLPTKAEYAAAVAEIWDTGILTNDGPLNKRLEEQLRVFLGLDYLRVTNNGTVVLQMALKALGIEPGSKIITTPFSYVATTNAILWEKCIPIFADIKPDDFNIDPDHIEATLREHPDAKAIMATHVYGNACEVDRIKAIADAHGLKVIYDAAHTFGATYKGQAILNYGDLSTCSFHATKVFHTIEGGCIVSHDAKMDDELAYLRSFGHRGDYYHSQGINAKNSEFHAAMGLVMLPNVPDLIAKRKQVAGWYDARLNFDQVTRPTLLEGMVYNYAYYPVLFRDEPTLERVRAALEAEKIFPRRYFYPSLNTLHFLPDMSKKACPVSDRVSVGVMSLPFHPELPEAEVERVSRIINENV